MSRQRAIILYGRAAFDRAQNVAKLAEVLQAEDGPIFMAAYTDLSGPSLPDVLNRLNDDGIVRALVVPCTLPADPSLTSWLPGALSAWREGCDTAMAVDIAPAIESVLDLAVVIRTAIAAPAEVLKKVADVPPGMGKPGWSVIPEHGRQIFFCFGARCLHRGAEPLYQHMRAAMKPHRRLAKGPGRVMCVRSSCQFPCNLGPLMTVHPDGVWYGGLVPARIDRIVEEHLLEGRIVADACIRRPPEG